MVKPSLYQIQVEFFKTSSFRAPATNGTCNNGDKPVQSTDYTIAMKEARSQKVLQRASYRSPNYGETNRQPSQFFQFSLDSERHTVDAGTIH
jgi:hypothetical protein